MLTSKWSTDKIRDCGPLGLTTNLGIRYLTFLFLHLFSLYPDLVFESFRACNKERDTAMNAHCAGTE